MNMPETKLSPVNGRTFHALVCQVQVLDSDSWYQGPHQQEGWPKVCSSNGHLHEASCHVLESVQKHGKNPMRPMQRGEGNRLQNKHVSDTLRYHAERN